MTNDDLQRALERGMAMARDPRNAQVRSLHDPRVTTIYSPWLLRVCAYCHHTFREDDIVLPDPAHPSQMLHDDPRFGLYCWHRAQQLPIEPRTTALRNEAVHAAFMRGLTQHWQPAGNQQTELVSARSVLIGRKCPICRHTVRRGDQVVLCPCGRGCNGAFHQDITRHLTCWNTWNRGEQRSYCGFTGAPFITAPREPLS